MISVSDILAVLNKWPQWKRTTECPDRVDALEERVSQLEKQLQSPLKLPGKPCKACGEHAVRRVSSKPIQGGLGRLGVKQETWQCEKCGDQDIITTEK